MRWLKPGGALVVKMFHGEGVDEWVKDMRQMLRESDIREARRRRERNRVRFMVIATGFTGDRAVARPSRWPL